MLKDLLDFIAIVIVVTFISILFALKGMTTTCYEAIVQEKIVNNEILVYAEEIDFYRQKEIDANFYNHVEIEDTIYLKVWNSKDGDYITSGIYYDYESCMEFVK